MVAIPDRENLDSMSRTDIQKLCKDNNIRANMRTDEMINALCDLASEKEAKRPHRAISQRVASRPATRARLVSQSSRNSVPPQSSKTSEVVSTKKAVQPSESNTDVESTADVPPSAPTTRLKAREIQIHLGKGRPMAAGGPGPRTVTKTSSRGVGRKARASAMLQEDPIPEEEEEAAVAEAPTTNINTEPAAADTDPQPSSVHPTGSCDAQSSQLPTPAPSQPSYSLPSAQINALEARVAQLESHNFATRISQLEASMAALPGLKASVAEIPNLQAEVKRLEVANVDARNTVDRVSRTNTELESRMTSIEVQVSQLTVENKSLKERIVELETRVGGRDDVSMSSVVIHSPGRNQEFSREKSKENVEVAPQQKAPATIQPIVPADPSPSQPTLGKRHRSETPDISEVLDGCTQKQREDAELEAIHRITRPKRKRARLDLEIDDALVDFPPFQPVRAGPSSTSTPRQHRSKSPSGFFTAGRRAPTPLVRKDDADSYFQLEPRAPVLAVDDASESNAVAGPSNIHVSPASARTHSSTENKAIPGFNVLTDADQQPPIPSDPMHDPAYFGSPPPIFFSQDTELPYPLHPSTPPNTQDILEQSAQFATPVLGAPWKYSESGYGNTANISQLSESIGLRMPAPTTPGGSYTTASGLHNPFAPGAASTAQPGSPGNYTFRAGGRRERNDKYNPYFTPQRDPGARYRTGLTPTRGFSVSLKSPAKMTTVAEEGDVPGPAEEDPDRSPPQLRTLYGTELEGDTRFGDYGTNLGQSDWGKFLTR